MAKASIPNRPLQSQPRVRRAYFECRYGQLHVHNAIPPGGGFEEGTPLLCVHSIPGSARAFERFLAQAGGDRSVYAPDLPGCGESDPPPSRPSIADHAAALGDFLDTMRFRQIDLLGYHAGALITAELAISRPQQVRRLVLASVPAFSDAERSSASGAGLQAAAQQHAVRDRLGLITQPTLVLRLRDEFWEVTPRVREWLPRARIVELPEQGQAMFETAPAAVMAALADFLQN